MVISAVLAVAAIAAEPPRTSRFTRLEAKSCKLRSVERETGDWTRLCPGAGPFRLEWSSGDLRENLVVLRGSRRDDLDLWNRVAQGAFSSLGSTVEWRGPAGKAPDVLVVRVRIADENGREGSGHLAVIRLAPKACVAAIVPPQPGQSAAARAIADRSPPPDCLPDDQ